MLPQIKVMVDIIIVECEDPNALDDEDIAYLNQIQRRSDLRNFDIKDSKMVALAADAARALGMSPGWIEENIDGPHYSAVEQTQNKRTESPLDFSHSGLGIGGLAHYDEPPVVPSVAAIKRAEKIEAEMQTCRRCGASDLLDGAMFTTMAGSGYCDDCC